MSKQDNEEDPLWKQVWKKEGIRYLGPNGDGSPDVMDRFRHAFELGMKYAHSEDDWYHGENPCVPWEDFLKKLFPNSKDYNNPKFKKK